MKTEAEIQERLEWLYKALDDEDNSTEISQIKIWQWIDALNWVIAKKR